MRKSLSLPVILAGILSVTVCTASEADVKASLNEFLTALHNLDLPRMQNCFADEVSVFNHAGVLTRIDSKDDLRKTHEQTLAFIREVVAKQGRTRPPYHDVGAQDIRVHMLSDDAAVATFVMPNPTYVRRATAAYAKRDGRWRIFHMHTSTRNLPK